MNELHRAAVALAMIAISPLAAVAQLGAPRPEPGWPGSGHRLDVQTVLTGATGRVHDGVLGCARDAAGNLWLVSRRASDGKFQTPHTLFRIDSRGAFGASFDQPAVTRPSPWGMRDLAFDGRRYLYGGFEGSLIGSRVLAFDTVRGLFDPTADVPLPRGLLLDTVRALAHDPTGDAGRGSLWLSDWDGPIVEVSKAGQLLRSLPAIQLDCYAAAWHPTRRTLWFFGQGGSDHPAGPRVVARELDPLTGTPTGLALLGDAGLPTAFAGGAEFGQRGGAVDLLVLHQADRDQVVQLVGDFDTAASSGGSCGLSGGPAFVGNPRFAIHLVGASGNQAWLAVGPVATDLPLPVPAFAPGSRLFVDFGTGGSLVGSFPILGGRASLSTPIPNSPVLGGAAVVFQWLETSSTGAPRTSRGGRFSIHP